MADGLEVELKLIAAGPGPLDRLATAPALGPVRLGPPVVVDELDRYLDTTDGRLARARWACRLRTRHGRTVVSMKGPALANPPGGASAVQRRPEREGPATDRLEPEAWPASPAMELLMELTGGAPLTERLALRQVRTERAVLRDGARVGTLSLDEVTVLHGGERRGELHVVELEMDPAARDDRHLLDDLDAALAAVDGLVADPQSKLEHALRLIRASAASSTAAHNGRP